MRTLSLKNPRRRRKMLLGCHKHLMEKKGSDIRISWKEGRLCKSMSYKRKKKWLEVGREELLTNTFSKGLIFKKFSH